MGMIWKIVLAVTAATILVAVSQSDDWVRLAFAGCCLAAVAVWVGAADKA